MATGPVIFNNNSPDELYLRTFDDKDRLTDAFSKDYKIAPFQKNVVIDAPAYPGNRGFWVHVEWDKGLRDWRGGTEGVPWADEDGYPIIRCLRGSTWNYKGHVRPLWTKPILSCDCCKILL